MPALSELAKARRRLVLKWRRFLGLCVGCGAEAYGNSKCQSCQAKANYKKKKERKEFKLSGLCQECGKNEAINGGYRCGLCIELMRLRRKPNQCHTDGCFNDVVYGHWYCKCCLELKNTESSKVYFIECPECGVLFASKYKRTPCCDDCRYERSKRLNTERKRRIKGLKLITKICAYYRCNNTFTTYKTNKTTCSELCSNRMIRSNSHQTRRAIKRGAKHIEKVDIGKLFMRDHGRCQICGKKLNLKRIVPHPLSITIDHIIPLCQGGEHSYKNTQLACFMCNSTKSGGSATGGDQLLLFG